MITVLAGGVGAARLLSGLVQVVPPERLSAVVNTGDDVVLHGLHVSPDLDTVTYTLAGAIDAERGWGLAGETWQVMEALERFAAVAPLRSEAALTWFRLGDRDLATHLYRTARMAEGAALSRVTAEIAEAWGVGVRVLPMTDDRVETRVTVEEGDPPDLVEVGFQEWFVQRQHSVPVRSLRFAGVESARPGHDVLPAVAGADVVVIAPSNPLVSIGPVLAVPGIREAVAARRDRVVAVSPIVGGRALKGPADRLLVEQGHESSVVGVARLYADVASVLVVDTVDAGLAADVEAVGLRCVVAPTVMTGPAEAAALGRVVCEVFG